MAMSFCLSVCLSVCLFVCLFVCLSSETRILVGHCPDCRAQKRSSAGAVWPVRPVPDILMAAGAYHVGHSGTNLLTVVRVVVK